MTLNESTTIGHVRRDLEPTHAVVVAAHGYVERAIEQAAWERRGVLGRLVRIAAPTDGVAAPKAAATKRAA